MLTLKAEKRNPDEKAKKLRRDGFITGVLYGKEMKENVSLKFTEKDASAFIKNAKEGTQAYLELDGKNVDVLVKNIDFDPLTKKYMALDFQALVAGEIVSATVPIVRLSTFDRTSQGMMNLLGFIMSLVYMQAVHGWLSAYERLVNSQFFSLLDTRRSQSPR